MAKRWTWRGAIITCLALLTTSFASGRVLFGGAASAEDGDRPAGTAVRATPAGPERYNPYVSGNRVVFTQVERKTDGSSTAAVWARDLVTGAESLVADVATGEPRPVTSDGWTAWSESPGDGRLAVKARANAGGPILDVFTTDWTPESFGSSRLDAQLPLAISGNNLSFTNGTPINPDVPELGRVSLPNTQPTLIDVMTTATSDFPDPIGNVAQAATTSVISEGNQVLFSIVDGNGNVIAAPSGAGIAGCLDTVDLPNLLAFDGNRVGIYALCPNDAGVLQSAIATCTLPCLTIEQIELPGIEYGIIQPNSLTLAGGKFVYSAGNGFFDSAIYSIDPVPGSQPVAIRTTSNTVGPRLSASGSRVVWDEAGYDNGTLSADIYMHDLATHVTTRLRRARPAEVVAPPTDPFRHDPDINGRRLVYAEQARDLSTAGIWTRSLTGAPTLVSNVATGDSVPRVSANWFAWSTRDPGAQQDRIFAARRPGGALIDVFNTDPLLNPYIFSFGGFDHYPARVDLTGNRVVVSASRPNPGGFYPLPAVWDKTLPAGTLTQLTREEESPQFGPLGAPQDSAGRGDRRNTVSIGWLSSAAPFRSDVILRTGVGDPGTVLADSSGCTASIVDVTTTVAVAASNCFYPQGPLLSSCALPCRDGMTEAIQIPNDPFPGPLTFDSRRDVTGLSAFDAKVAVSVRGFGLAGRNGSRVVQKNSVEVYDLARPNDPPVSIIIRSGAISEPRIDGNHVVFGIVKQSDGKIGTIYLYNLRTRTLSTL